MNRTAPSENPSGRPARFLPVLLAAGLLLATAAGALAADRLGLERTIAETLSAEDPEEEASSDNPGSESEQSDRSEQSEQSEQSDVVTKGRSDGTPSGQAEEADEPSPWAVVPQVGYSPERGANAGLKLVHREFTSAGLTLDLAALVAMEGQQSYDVDLVLPGRWGIAMIEGDFSVDPRKEFFGLGNESDGPDPLSTHEIEERGGRLTLGVRPYENVVLAVSGGITEMRLRRGDLEDDVPSTFEARPELVGLEGGRIVPLGVSLVFDTRDHPTRPTEGVRMLLQAEHVDRSLGSDFETTRYAFDVSTLFPLVWRRQVIGLRIGGELVEGHAPRVPFWSEPSLGGSDDLRGFFDDRFLGRGRIVTTAEYRLKLLDFDFFDIWPVKIDGVGFGEAGRVFAREGRDDEDAFGDEHFDRFHPSWGGGVRIALGRAILARIDVGFSDEESGLTYLTFGHTF